MNCEICKVNIDSDSRSLDLSVAVTGSPNKVVVMSIHISCAIGAMTDRASFKLSERAAMVLAAAESLKDFDPPVERPRLQVVK